MPPNPSEPATIPTDRNSTSTGTPSRAENLLEAIPSSNSKPVSSTARFIHMLLQLEPTA